MNPLIRPRAIPLRLDGPGRSTQRVRRSVSPLAEMGAYEALWLEPGATFTRLAEMFRLNPGALPSDLVPSDDARETGYRAMELFTAAGIRNFGVRVNGAGEYPLKLRDAKHPIELLYYQGWWDLVDSPSIAIVGTRQPTPEGLARTRRLVRELVGDGYTIMSGLARGIDTQAHLQAIESGGRTIAVIGTPLADSYPKENAELQKRIGSEYLLISQVPVCRYAQQTFRENRLFFPERNVTMSALTQATIIVEASETSGTRTQARAAIHQGRHLFILDSCLRREGVTWPQKLIDDGQAVRVAEYNDIRRVLLPGRR